MNRESLPTRPDPGPLRGRTTRPMTHPRPPPLIRRARLLPPGPRLGGLATVAAKGPGRGELPELVADHILGDIKFDEVASIMDGEVLPHELGYDRAGPGPGLDRLPGPRGIGPVDFREQTLVDIGPF